MSTESIMPPNHFILSCPLLLLPSIFPSIRVFSSELAFCIRWPKYWSFSFSISPSKMRSTEEGNGKPHEQYEKAKRYDIGHHVPFVLLYLCSGTSFFILLASFAYRAICKREEERISEFISFLLEYKILRECGSGDWGVGKCVDGGWEL